MKEIPLIVEEVIFDWRSNSEKSVRILEVRLEYPLKMKHLSGTDHLEFIKGGYPSLKDNEWLVDPAILFQGTDAVLTKHPYRAELANARVIYKKKSPINPLTSEFQKEIYQKLHEIATPDLVKQLFLEEHMPCEDIDISGKIEPEHGFLGFDGSVHACSDFTVYGKLRKKIGDREFVLHTTSRDYGHTGGLFFDGFVDSLKSNMITVSKPIINFVLDKKISVAQKRFLFKAMNYHPFTVDPWNVYIDKRHMPKMKSFTCEYEKEHERKIARFIRMLSKGKLSIEDFKNDSYKIITA